LLLGNAAAQHPDSAALERLGRWIAEQTGATFGWLVDGGNGVGAQLVGAAPQDVGATADEMLGAGAPLKACILMNVEPSLDAADPPRALAALSGAEMVVAMTAFMRERRPSPTCCCPIAPFTETSGTFVNAEGRVQSMHGVVKPRGEARPAWKMLRVLGNLLGLPGFAFETSEEVRDEALGDVSTIAARLAAPPSQSPDAAPALVPTRGVLERIADVPIYAGRSDRAPRAGVAAHRRRAAAGRRPSRASSPPSAASSTARRCASARAGRRS